MSPPDARRSRPIRLIPTLLFAGLALSACGRDLPNFSGSSESSAKLRIEPSRLDLFDGQSFLFDVRLAGDSVIGDARLEVSVDDTRIARADADGSGRAFAPGQTTLRAQFEGESASAEIFVAEGTLVSLEVNPSPVSLTVGQTVTLQVTGVLSTGARIDLSGSAGGTRYESSDSSIASVSNRGVVQGVSAGVTELKVQQGDVSTFVTVGVGGPLPEIVSMWVEPDFARIEQGQSIRLNIFGQSNDGTIHDLIAEGYPVDLLSIDSRVAEVDSAARVTGLFPGNSSIIITLGDLLAECFIEVIPSSSELVSLQVVPDFVLMQVDETFQLQVLGYYSDGSVRDLTSANTGTSYEVQNNGPAVATINGSGRLRGRRQGQGTVLVQNSGLVATAALVVVDNVQVIGLEIEPSPITVTVGQETSFRVFAITSDMRRFDVTGSSETVLRVSSPGIANVTSAGRIRGLQIGRTQLEARYRNVGATAEVLVVEDAELLVLYFRQPLLTLEVGEIGTFSVLGQFSDGSIRDLTFDPGLTVRSINPQVAQLIGRDTLEALSPGMTDVFADYRGATARLQVFVRGGMIQLVAIQLVAASTMVVGDISQLYVLGIYSDGSFADVTFEPGMIIQSDDPTIAAVMGTDLFAQRVGRTMVTASLQGLVSSIEVRVTAQPDRVLDLRWIPASLTLQVGQSAPAHLEARYQSGNITNVTYDPGVMGNVNGPITILPAPGDEIFVRGDAIGTGTVDATFGGLRAVLTVNVGASNQLVGIDLLVPATIELNRSESYSVIARYSDGSSTDVTFDPGVQLTVLPANRLAVGMGSLTGLTLGVARVEATYQGFRDFARVEVVTAGAPIVSIAFVPSSVVLLPGQSTTVSLIGTRADGTTVDLSFDPGVGYSPSPGINAVIGPNGLEVSAAPNVTMGTVEGRYQMFSATLTVTVQTSTLIGIRAEPSPLNMNAGTVQSITVFGQYSDGRELVVTGASFQSANPMIASVNNFGRVTGVSGGMTAINVSFGGFTVQVPVTVTMATLIGIRAEPNPLTLDAGDAQTITVIGLFDDGSEAPIIGATFASSNTTVATVSGAGLVTARGPGTSIITIDFQTFSTTVAVNVTGAILVGLRVVPEIVTLGVGDTVALQVFGQFNDGTERLLTTGLSFLSFDPGVASVNGNGVVTANRVGVTVINIDGPNGLSAPALVSVVAGTVPTLISVTPDSILAGSPATLITVTGTGFLAGDELAIISGGMPTLLSTNIASATRATATVPASLLSSSASLELRLFRQSGPSISNPLFILVGRAPTVDSIAPDIVVAGSTTRIELSGSDLLGLNIAGSPLAIAGIGETNGSSASFDATAASNAPTGPVVVTVSNPFGSTTITINIIAASGQPNLVVASGQTVVLSGTNVYQDVTVQTGGRIVGSGLEPLSLIATGNMTIRGRVEVNGFDGAPGFQDPAEGGDAGSGGGGGGGGGDGDARNGGSGGAGAPAGENGSGGQGPGTPGGDGGGNGGGSGAANQCGAGGGGGALGGDGGDGGGDFGDGSGGNGGSSVGAGSNFGGGTGGGGGTTCGPNAGAGAGGGGGVLILQVALSGTLLVDGVLEANGGRGGDGFAGTGGGGGGSGGRISLRAFSGTIRVNDNIRANGGNGGNADFGDSGGGGGGGIIRLEAMSVDTSLGTLDVDGGLPGSSLGAGASGRPGQDGIVRVNP